MRSKLALVIVFFTLSTTMLHAGEQPVIAAVSVGPKQQAPLQVVGIGELEDPQGRAYFGEFDIHNQSKQPVVVVQLGWVLRHCGSELEDTRYCSANAEKEIVAKGVGLQVPVFILPNKLGTASTPVVFVKEKLHKKIQQRGLGMDHYYLVDFGMVYARFVDGTEWEFDLVNESDWEVRSAISSTQAPAVFMVSLPEEGETVPACIPNYPNHACANRYDEECFLPVQDYQCCCRVTGRCSSRSCLYQCETPASGVPQQTGDRILLACLQ
jgi:hypothetical protein